MPFVFPDWRQRLNDPITSGLLLSLSLHLALLGVVQPAPGGGEMESLVINARLVPTMQEASQIEPQAVSEPMPETATEAAVPPVTVPQSLLTSHVPSPAPSLPTPPNPVAPTPAPLPTAAPVVVPATTSVNVPEEAKSTSASAAAIPARPLSLGIDSTWYVARQVDVTARAVGAITPNYPDDAKRRNQEGSLKLMVRIDDLGRVRDVEVVEADMPGVFDAAALEAFRNARYQPAMKDGHPVRYQAFIRVEFKLRD